MKELIFVTQSDLSGTSGHNIATKEIVAAMARNDRIDLIVLCPAPELSFPDEIARDAARIEHFWSVPRETPVQRVRSQLSLGRLLRRTLRRERPDAVVTRHGATMVAPALLAARYDIDHVLLVRGRSYANLKFAPLLKRIFRLNVRLSSDVYVAFEAIRADAAAARTTDQSNPIVFRNAVDPTLFRPKPKAEVREALALPDGFTDADLVVGFVGSLKERHHVSELLDAADHIGDERSLSILVVGSGPSESALRNKSERIDADVYFTGFVDHGDVPDYVATCDLLYGVVDPNSPSNPIKCYEYLACERPILTSDVTEFSFVKRIDAGFLVDSLGSDVIAKRLGEAAECPTEELHEMGARGRKYVVENHTWDQLPELILSNLD